MNRPILLFDFDGTTCLGEGPVRLYAEAALSKLPAADRENASRLVEGYLRGEELPDEEINDAYDLVRRLAEPVAGSEELQSAYLSSRERLGDKNCDIYPAPGIADLLSETEGRATRVLATNSPELGMHEALDRLGLSNSFDEVHFSTGKPAGLPSLINHLLDGQPPSQLLSIGDHWKNDIAPAVAAGAGGMLITPYRVAAGPCNAFATSLVELRVAINEWVDAPSQWLLDHPASEGSDEN